MIVRRLGKTPVELGTCTEGLHCPDVFELESGNFAVIGRDITVEARNLLPADAGCGLHERIVELPRRTLIAAKADIPEA